MTVTYNVTKLLLWSLNKCYSFELFIHQSISNKNVFNISKMFSS